MSFPAGWEFAAICFCGEFCDHDRQNSLVSRSLADRAHPQCVDVCPERERRGVIMEMPGNCVSYRRENAIISRNNQNALATHIYGAHGPFIHANSLYSVRVLPRYFAWHRESINRSLKKDLR